MKARRVGDNWLVRLERGDNVIEQLVELAQREDIRLASLAGIGAIEHIELRYYDVSTREYSSKQLPEQHEVTGLMGTVSQMDGKPYLHLHVTLGDKEFRGWAGHLAAATVSATLELVIRELPGEVERFTDEAETGLNLWKL